MFLFPTTLAWRIAAAAAAAVSLAAALQPVVRSNHAVRAAPPPRRAAPPRPLPALPLAKRLGPGAPPVSVPGRPYPVTDGAPFPPPPPRRAPFRPPVRATAFDPQEAAGRVVLAAARASAETGDADEGAEGGAGSALAPVARALSRSVGSLLRPEGQAPPAPEGAGQTPAAPPRELIPIAGGGRAAELQLSDDQGLVSLVARQAPLSEILWLLAQTQGLRIVASDSADTRVSVTLERTPWRDVLDSVLAVAGYTWFEHNGMIHVTPVSGGNLPAGVQGRRIQVFELDYVAAADLEASVSAMLSPAGQSFVIQSDQADNLRTREAIVVEDLPDSLERIAQYIAQVDRPPRQVLIEAHVLQVELSDDLRHGVNYKQAFALAGADAEIQWTGFANPAAPQAFFARIDGTDVESLVECLQTTTDAKTLANPRVLVLNGQTARIQIGEQLGFRVTTTTETSTMESVDFLDVGVVLEVTPRIARDGRVLMQVRPEVSSGQVNPETGLPEEETTHVDTQVMLEDGKGVVIGGLIKEKDSNTQSKLPLLGDWWLVGKLFQKRVLEKSRSEIVITLVPRVLPYDAEQQAVEDQKVMAAHSPLFYGPLNRAPRPWEAQLPDTVRNPVLLRLPPIQGRPVRCVGAVSEEAP